MDMRHQFRPATVRPLPAGAAGLRRRLPGRLLAAAGLLVLAVSLAALAAILAGRWLEAEATRRAGRLAAPLPMGEVWLVGSPLAAGTAFSPSSVRRADWPAASVPGTAIPADPARLRGLAGRRLAQDVPEGAVLLEGHFLAEGASGALAFRLSPGMRAITVPVTASSGLSGLVQPGDRVDILFAGALPDGGRVSETVLADVKVLGIDRQLDAAAAEAGADPSVPGTVTLEVTPQGAEALALLADAGRLTLALRGKDARGADGPSAMPGPAGAAALLARLAAAVKAVEPAPAPPPAPSAGAAGTQPLPPPPPGGSPGPAPSATMEGGVAVVRGSSIRSSVPAAAAAP